MIFTNVDFPDPFGPVIAMNLSVSIFKFILSNIFCCLFQNIYFLVLTFFPPCFLYDLFLWFIIILLDFV